MAFDRFYIDKSRARSQGGNGLGLQLPKRSKSHGGYISVDSELNKRQHSKIQF